MEVSDDELDILWPKACINVPHVTNTSELQVFIAEKMDEGVDMYGFNLPYRMYLCPNVDGKNGYMFFIASHAFFDGMSMISSF